MEDWLVSSLISCALYAAWSLCQALAVGPSGQLTSFEARTIITLLPFSISLIALCNSPSLFRFGSLPLGGLFFALCAGITTFFAGKYYSTALAPPQSGAISVVTAITGAYPAVAFVVSVALGLEKVDMLVVILFLSIRLGPFQL